MRNVIQHALHSRGIEMRTLDAPTRSFSRGLRLLKSVVSPTTVIDIGVATGTPNLYEHFPPGNHRYMLVEANPLFKDDLDKLRARLDAVAIGAFCGSEPGQVELKIYSDPRKASAYVTTRGLAVGSTAIVPVQTLDNLVAEHCLIPPYLIKLDVEGAEVDVIRGARNTLLNTDAVIAEASVLPRFNGGAGFADLVGAMDESGFAVFDILSGVNHPKTGYLYQVDLVFVRADARFRSSNINF